VSAGVSKSRRYSNRDVSNSQTSLLAAVAADSPPSPAYVDSMDAGVHHTGGMTSIMPSWCPHGVSSKPLGRGKSTGSGDSSATATAGMKTVDDNTIIGGILTLSVLTLLEVLVQKFKTESALLQFLGCFECM